MSSPNIHAKQLSLPATSPLGITSAKPQFLSAPQTSQRGVLVRARVLSELFADGRRFVLTCPIVATVEREFGGYWVHQCEEFGVLAYGPTEDCSREEFEREFAYAWDGLANEPDESLTADARQLKARLHDFVDHIETL